MQRQPHRIVEFCLLRLISAIHPLTRLRVTIYLTKLPAISPRISELGAFVFSRPCPPNDPIIQVDLVASSLQGSQAREYGLYDKLNVLVISRGIDLCPNIRSC